MNLDLNFISVHTVHPYGKKLIIATPRNKRELNQLNEIWELFETNPILCATYEVTYEEWKSSMVVFNMSHKQSVTYGMISHEATHVVDDIFKTIGHTYDPDNNEVGAYLNEWITNKIFEHFINRDLFFKLSCESKIKNNER